MWLFINLGGAQEDSQREEFNRNLKPKFHDRFQSFIFGLVWPVDAVINCQRQHQQILMFFLDRRGPLRLPLMPSRRPSAIFFSL